MLSRFSTKATTRARFQLLGRWKNRRYQQVCILTITMIYSIWGLSSSMKDVYNIILISFGWFLNLLQPRELFSKAFRTYDIQLWLIFFFYKKQAQPWWSDLDSLLHFAMVFILKQKCYAISSLILKIAQTAFAQLSFAHIMKMPILHHSGCLPHSKGLYITQSFAPLSMRESLSPLFYYLCQAAWSPE